MLIKFAVTNFRGFKNKLEWDLSRPNNYSFSTNAIKNDVIKNGIIYGPNGSGKTNFGLAIFDIEYHLSQKWKKLDYFDNYIYAGNENNFVKFEYTFNFDSQIVEYSYTKKAGGVLVGESMKVDNKFIFSKDEKTLEINDTLYPIEESVKENLINNANNVSIVNFILLFFPLDANHYLIKLQNFVGSMLWFRNLDVREFIGLETTVTKLDEYIISNNLLSDFSNFLNDVSEQHFDFSTDSSEKQLLCKINETTVPFHLIASTGTRSLQLLYFWIKRMSKDASFVFIDEFDAFYHYKLSFKVCKQLFDLNCQVFMSSHNTYLMTNDLLRPDCNFILNNGCIKALSDCTEKELRFGHNIEKIYRAGAFYGE